MKLFDVDQWNEIFETLGKNRLRSFLTAFGVFWGIFMLMIMLGSGEGLQNGVQSDFGARATNSLNLWTMRTSMPYNGFQRGRYIQLRLSDVDELYARVPELDTIAPRNRLGGWRGSNNVQRKNKSGAFNVFGDYPAYNQIEPIRISRGRYLNDLDIREKRKVAVIGEKVREILFTPNEDPLGDYIEINGVFFQVVGCFESFKSGNDAEEETQTVYIPFTAFAQAFNFGDYVGWMAMTAKPGIKVSEAEVQVMKVLKDLHDIHPDDDRAIGSWNMQEMYDRMNGLFGGIRLLSLIVGTLTLLAGAIGISNIMLVVIRERTREIGVRRALGATPWAVMQQIMLEALVLTVIAGVLGILAGVWAIEGLNSLLSDMSDSSGSFKNPEVHYQTVLFALAILIGSGLLAGIIPARRAVSIKPVDAIRDE